MSIIEHINKKEESHWRNIMTRVVLVLLTTFLIVWFLPRNEGKQFAYEVGEPWHYGTIIAKYDFPIYKTEDALAKEKDSLLSQFQPYFNYDHRVEGANIEKFKKDFAGGLPNLPASFEATIIDRLHRLYQAGIMETPNYNSIASGDTTSLVRVIFGKNVESIFINCVFSTMSAYEQLLNDEALAGERTALQRLNLNNYIEPNLIYDRERSETAKNDLLSGISPASGMVMSGQKIISVGDMVNDYNYRVLHSLEKEMERRSASDTQLTNMLIGNTLYVFILVLTFTVYLALFRKDYFNKPRSIAMVYTLITVFPILVSLMMEHSYFSFSVYILPFAFLPIFVRVFMDSRTAFIAHIIMVLICAAAVRYQFEFIFVQTVAGLVAIYSLREMSSRSQVFKTALMVFLAMGVTYFTLKLMQSGEEFNMDTSMYYHFLICGVLLLLAYPLMYLIEKAFGFISIITLIELSNTNRGLLRNLSEVAPGTFQHSITVGNLASEIANKIGANSTLVRTGALYHDIGKMINPVFFTENQQGGINPHDNLTDKESAKIIIEHVPNGVKLAEEANLPVAIRDFIRTHHGRGLAKYFYINYQNEHPDEIVDKELFTYPGPNPYTLEQAILMMADSCEAASHSLNEYSEENITSLVNNLIDQRVAEGCFKECKITFYDISVAKQVLIDRLKAIYHTRIQYPTSNK
ncbi:MAG: HDIG domain-containing protein [Prevotella sp.]|nr:HDIG domain-containing protein [Prevotella sp.]